MKRLSAVRRWTSPASMRGPLAGLDHPGDHVERPGPVDAVTVGVDGERDAHRQDVGRRAGLAGVQLVDAEAVDQRQHASAAAGARRRRLVPVAELVRHAPPTVRCVRDTRDVDVTPRRDRSAQPQRAWTVASSVRRSRRAARPPDIADAVRAAGRLCGSLGRPRTRSPTMLRWIWLVPPQIVSEREKKNDDIIGLTGIAVAPRLSRGVPGHEPAAGPASTSIACGAVDVERQLHRPLVHLRPEHLVERPERGDDRVLRAGQRASTASRRPLMRRIWIFV